jgi:FkbM family methyltransferase
MDETTGAPTPPQSGGRAAAFAFPTAPIISYAQTHEDVLLWRALQDVESGFYIDVGAHDPSDLSVTRAFYDAGWCGINIEPDPLFADKLRRERPRDITLEVALGERPGEATLHQFRGAGSGLSTLIADIADEHKAAGLPSTERRISVTTLKDVTKDFGGRAVHFLKIDVEGSERAVLAGADFTKFRPWIVLLEATRPMTNIDNSAAWEPLLLAAGYQHVYFDGLNRFYVAAEKSAELARYFSVPVCISDPFRDAEKMRLEATVATLRQQLAEAGVERAALRDWIRAAMLTEVLRVQEAITEVLALSRWRRFGQHLGLARRTGWERSAWQSGSQGAAPGMRPLGDLQTELARLETFLDEMRRSRWRKLGQWLGVAKRLAWESGGERNPLLTKPPGGWMDQ